MYIPRIIVVCETKIFIFELTTCTKIETIETFSNPKGLISIREEENNSLLAYPDSKRGFLRIKSSNNDIQDSQLINAHESSLACISFNREGTLICTASDKGTIIRVFTVQKGTLVRELRRGSGDAEIYSLSFSSDSKFLACSSDRGTIHVFILNVNIDEENEETENTMTTKGNDVDDEPKNQKSFLSKISNFFGKTGGYFNSEWSFARISNISDSKTICSFRPGSKTLNIIGSSGRYYHAVFSLKSGGTGTIAEDFKLGV